MLFAAVSMGFIAENIREKHIEDERAEELMHAFINDVQENQKQLDSLIINNSRSAHYFDSLSFNHGFVKKQIDLKALAETIDLWVYRFVNKKTIFEQMKSSGALRYIQDKEILNAVLRYEENANFAEVRSLIEVDHYNNEFRPALANIFPISFSKYISESQLKNMTKMDTIVHPGRYENYHNYDALIQNELENAKLTDEQMKVLAKAWHFRQERISVGLRTQIKLKEQGKELLTLIEKKYSH
jgi:hypothetical protein